MPIRSCHCCARPASRLGEMKMPFAQAGERADADILGDRPQRENAVRLAVAGDERDRCGHLDAGRQAWSMRDRYRSSRLVWPWPERPARPMISPSWATSSAPSCWRAGRARIRSAVAFSPRCGAARRRLRRGCNAFPWRRPACRGRMQPPRPRRPPCRRASPRCGRQYPRISPSRWEIRMQLVPSATMRRTKCEELTGAAASSEEVGSSRMTRRSGSVSDGEGAGHLDHLALADRQVADHVRRRRCHGPGKISSSLVCDQLAGAPAPAQALQRRHD